MTSAKNNKRLWVLAISAVVFGACCVATHFISENAILGVDKQKNPCIDARILVVWKSDELPAKGDLFAFRAPKGVEPVYDAGTLFAKRVVGQAGDMVEIKADETIWVNDTQVGRGLPHLALATQEQKQKFYGKRRLGDGEWWVMGDAIMSFDSRYWGVVKTEDLLGRAYVIF